MSRKDMLLCLAFAVLLPVGQSLFKFAANYDARLAGPLPARLFLNPPLIAAGLWYGLTALLWFYVLTRVPLSTAYAFSLLGAALVPLIGWLVFKEAVSWRMAAGYGLLLAGLFLIVARPAA